MVADGDALLSTFCVAKVRRGRGEGLERRVTVDPCMVCSSSLADEETLIESGGVEEP